MTVTVDSFRAGLRSIFNEVIKEYVESNNSKSETSLKFIRATAPGCEKSYVHLNIEYVKNWDQIQKERVQRAIRHELRDSIGGGLNCEEKRACFSTLSALVVDKAKSKNVIISDGLKLQSLVAILAKNDAHYFEGNRMLLIRMATLITTRNQRREIVSN